MKVWLLLRCSCLLEELIELTPTHTHTADAEARGAARVSGVSGEKERLKSILWTHRAPATALFPHKACPPLAPWEKSHVCHETRLSHRARVTGPRELPFFVSLCARVYSARVGQIFHPLACRHFLIILLSLTFFYKYWFWSKAAKIWGITGLEFTTKSRDFDFGNLSFCFFFK